MSFIFLLFGLIIGSFLNVCIYRIPRDESISYPPSHCTKCGYNLKTLDLIPIISYIFLKGRCKSCKDKISSRYPLIEGLNGILYLVIFKSYGLSIESIFLCLFTSLLIVISMIDFDTKEVYIKTTIFGALLGILYIGIASFYGDINYIDNLLGGLVGFLIIFLIVKITGGMGEGDAEIAGICGLFLGVQGIILALFIAIVTGGIVGSIILLLKLKDKKEEIAFGPYIALGTITCMLYGPKMIDFYLNYYIYLN